MTQFFIFNNGNGVSSLKEESSGLSAIVVIGVVIFFLVWAFKSEDTNKKQTEQQVEQVTQEQVEKAVKKQKMENPNYRVYIDND